LDRSFLVSIVLGIHTVTIKARTFFLWVLIPHVFSTSHVDTDSVVLFVCYSICAYITCIDTLVRAPLGGVYKGGPKNCRPHTYLDGTSPFTYPGLWAVGTLHSTATLSIQRVIAACMGFGSCTVSIFSCPASATLAGRAPFFWSQDGPNPNPSVHITP
jgi:hypothetical protein